MNEAKALKTFYFSQMLGKPIYDSENRQIGRIKDMAVRWDGLYPQVVGIKYAKKVHMLIPIEQVQECNEQGMQLVRGFVPAQCVPLHESDIYISKWLLDKQIIDLRGSRMVRANDITLSWMMQDGHMRMILVAVDIGLRGLFRRLGLEFLLKNRAHNLLGLQYIKPLESWTSSLQMTREKKQLRELHPADIADLLEEMDYKSRASFIENLDAQQAIEALTEVDLETQVEIFEQMDRQKASDLLEEMPPDEAADILGELSVEKSEDLLQLMEAEDAAEVRELMQYEEGTAGALMTTEYIAFAGAITAQEAINRLRELAPAAEMIYYVFVVDETEHLQGVLSLRELIIAHPQTVLQDIMHTKVESVREDDSHRRVAEVINKYSLIAVPVVDEANVILGIVTVDDILDILIPERGDRETYPWFAMSKMVGRGR